MNTHVNNFKTWNTRPLFVCGLAENPYLYNVTIKKKKEFIWNTILKSQKYTFSFWNHKNILLALKRLLYQTVVLVLIARLNPCS